jgi:hypothetical protein
VNPDPRIIESLYEASRAGVRKTSSSGASAASGRASTGLAGTSKWSRCWAASWNTPVRLPSEGRGRGGLPRQRRRPHAAQPGPQGRAALLPARAATPRQSLAPPQAPARLHRQRLGAEARRLMRATPPPRGRGTTRQPGATARRGVLALANGSPILYIHCAYGNGRFQDATFPARRASRQAIGGVRREEPCRGRVAARSHGP